MTSLIDLVNALVEQKSADAVELSRFGAPQPWSGSDDARAARADLERRIDAIVEKLNRAVRESYINVISRSELDKAYELLTGELPEGW